MTTPTEQDLRALAYLAPKLRPRGSKPWKDTDVFDCCKRLAAKGYGLTEITNRVLVHAQDPKADAPTVIVVPPKHEPAEESRHFRPPKRDDECPVHPGSYATACSGCAADRHAGTPAPPGRSRKTPPPPEWAKARAALRRGGDDDE